MSTNAEDLGALLGDYESEDDDAQGSREELGMF